MSLAALKAFLPQSLSAFFASGLPGIVLEADGRPYHNAGAGRALELGAMLCVGDEYLRMVKDSRHPIIHALPHIGFATSLDGDFSAGLVKLHVLRGLWLRLQQEHDIKQPLSAIIHVETSMRMLSRRLIALNSIRNQCAAMAAIAGDVRSLSLLPESTVLGLANAQARHKALTMVRVLMCENLGLNQVNPAFMAAMKTQIADLEERAWAYYQYFMRSGGVIACLIDGSLAQKLVAHHQQRTTSKITGQIKHKDALHRLSETSFADIYDTAPAIPDIEGIEHCLPLNAVFDEV